MDDTTAFVLAGLAALVGLAMLWLPSAPSASPAPADDPWRRARRAAEAALDDLRAARLDDAAAACLRSMGRELRQLCDELERDRVRGRASADPARLARAFLPALDAWATSLGPARRSPDPAAALAAARAELQRLRLVYHLGDAAPAAAAPTPEPGGPEPTPSLARARAWVPMVLRELGRLHRDRTHTLKNKLAASQRYRDDLETFGRRFFKDRNLDALDQLVAGDDGLAARLDALAPSLVAPPGVEPGSPLAVCVDQVLAARGEAADLTGSLQAWREAAPPDMEAARRQVEDWFVFFQGFAEQLGEARAAHRVELAPLVEDLDHPDLEVVVEADPEAAVHALEPRRAQDAWETALENLVQNAAQAGASRVRVSLATEGDLLTLVVADDGPGIPEDRREAALTEGVSTKGPGGGAGLPQARRVAQEAGGELRLAEAEGGGLAVRIEVERS